MLDLTALGRCSTIEEVGNVGPIDAPHLRDLLCLLGRPDDLDLAKELAIERMYCGSNQHAYDVVRARRQ